MRGWKPGWRSGFRTHRWQLPKLSRKKRPIPRWRSMNRRKRVHSVSGGDVNFAIPWQNRKKKPRRKRRIFFISLVIFMLLSVYTFIYVDKHVRGPFMHLAKIRVKQIATQAINKAITEQVMRGRELNKLIEWKTDSRGKVTSVALNYNEQLRITSDTVDVVQSTLKGIHELRDDIPLGLALGSPLLASFGPRIPVRMEPQGAAKVELNTRPRNVGINMVIIEVYIKVVEEVAIVIPFDLEPEVVETEIPISYLLVVGDVPMYYYDGKGQPVGTNRDKAPTLSLPIHSSPEGVLGPSAPRVQDGTSVATPLAEPMESDQPVER